MLIIKSKKYRINFTTFLNAVFQSFEKSLTTNNRGISKAIDKRELMVLSYILGSTFEATIGNESNELNRVMDLMDFFKIGDLL